MTVLNARDHGVEVAALDRHMHEVVRADAGDTHQPLQEMLERRLDIEGYLLGLAETQAATGVPTGFQVTVIVSPGPDRKLTSQLANSTWWAGAMPAGCTHDGSVRP
jgi:hypothetical protein